MAFKYIIWGISRVRASSLISGLSFAAFTTFGLLVIICFVCYDLTTYCFIAWKYAYLQSRKQFWIGEESRCLADKY